ncbi:peroxiredoxin family protein [Halobacillus aidingensis]|uniref:Peroxiredoxin n=1 Tax=Halobacillus aidingensis TaxID=240303 RepID=A0A1H0UBD3_HALAD|nr:peroxiredoxin family protein [Halobacillus aidingensis]SDP63315.1 Peroxiredoxin [Halobacillus aidingensis]
MPDLQLGDRIPNFYLPSTEGKNYLFENFMQEHENKWHLIVFFRGSWSPICIEELEKLEDSKVELENQNLQTTAISTDYLEDLKNLVRKNNLTFPVLSDEYVTVIEAFGVFLHKTEAPYEDHGVHGEPAYFIINEDGQLMYQHKQTSPFGRPSPEALVKITKYISNHLKAKP